MRKKFLHLVPTVLIERAITKWPNITYFCPEREYKIPIDNGVIKQTINLNPKYRIEKEVLYSRTYDPKVLGYINTLVKSDDTCLDIGANFGWMSLAIASKLGEKGRLICYEPGPTLFDRLSKNIALCDFKCSIESIPLGLSDQSGEMFWKMNKSENYGNASLFQKKSKDSSTVHITTLDAEKDDHSLKKLDFIKIDVEGMEHLVFRGGQDLLERTLPTIVMETLVDYNGKNVEQSVNFLQNLGYHFFESSIPEVSIQQHDYRIGLIACSFPNLPADTVAIHKSKIPLFADLLHGK